MKRSAFAALVAALAASVANVQQAAPGPVTFNMLDGHQVMPANTEIVLALNQELSSKTARQGQVFDVSVSRDVFADGRLAVPRGAHGTGAVTWRTGKGAFGSRAR